MIRRVVRHGRRNLVGWGRTAPTSSEVVGLVALGAVRGALARSPRGVLGRGLGRSSRDGAQNAGGMVADGTTSVGVSDLDPATRRLTSRAGTSLVQLMTWLVPEG